MLYFYHLKKTNNFPNTDFCQVPDLKATQIFRFHVTDDGTSLTKNVFDTELFSW